jgi:hypothetical protein
MEDRRHAEASHRGGIDAERAEREIMRKERDAEQQRQHKAFKEMMRKAREDKRAADEIQARAEAESKGETYVAPEPANPAEEARKFPNTIEDEPQIYEVKDEENDAPPELEQVNIEEEREKRLKE